MATRRDRTAVPVALACLAALLSGCAGDGGGGRDRAAVQRLLDERAAAVLDHDRRAFLAAVEPGADGFRAAQGAMLDNLRDVPLSSWSYRLASRPADGGEAEVELRFRLRGYDTVAVTATEHVRLAERDGRWYLAGSGPKARYDSQQPWDQGPVRVVRGRHALVLGVGWQPKTLTALARTADRAVPAVTGVWPADWSRRLVILAPATLDGMGRLLGAPSAGYRGIAAVTTGEAGAVHRAPADRVVVNPEAYALLGDVGKRIVLTHEAVHVATRTATSPATPLWLSEGLADFTAYRGAHRTPRQGALELARAVAAGKPLGGLPADGDFRFGSDGDRLAQAYEKAWLACRMAAERWGERRLVAFYRAVGAAERRRGSVAHALRSVYGVTPERFTALWRRYVTRELG